MSRLVRRWGHLRAIVGRTALRDLRNRRARAADRQLVAARGQHRTPFPSTPGYPERVLPAREVPLQVPAQYAASVTAEVRAALRARGIHAADISQPSSGKRALLVRHDDWQAATASLLAGVPGALVAPAPAEADPGPADLVLRTSLSTAELESCTVLHVMVPAVTRRHGQAVKRYGFDTALTVQRATTGPDGRHVLPVWDARTADLGDAAFDHEASAEEPGSGSVPPRGTDALESPNLLDVTFPIDAVYTWVDGTDPAWLTRKRQAVEDLSGERLTEAAADDLRFISHDELRYSLRSLEQYAPWIRHVYIVTDQQVPDWLDRDHPWISIVDHQEIAPPGTVLPTFNSQAIEANLHRIDGLSEHFLYFNDDMFLSSPVAPQAFFSAAGIANVAHSRAHVGYGDPFEGEPAPDSAGKNARRLVEEISGARVSQKFFHTPYPLRRSLAVEIEGRWPEVVAETRRSVFRRTTDITLAGALQLNYALATGRAVSRRMRYRYVSIGEADAPQQFEGLLADRDVLQAFCLNEAAQELPASRIDDLVRAFLARRFPDVGTFELPGR